MNLSSAAEVAAEVEKMPRLAHVVTLISWKPKGTYTTVRANRDTGTVEWTTIRRETS